MWPFMTLLPTRSLPGAALKPVGAEWSGFARPALGHTFANVALFAWLASTPVKRSRAVKQISEALREAGVLMLVFAPLDLAMKDQVATGRDYLWYFLGTGFVLLVLGMLTDWSRQNAD